MTRLVRLSLLVMVFLGAAAPMLAQAPVAPGGIATRIAAAPAAQGADSVGYHLETTPGVRSFGPASGTAAVDPARGVRIPFTFAVPASAVAGRFVLGRVFLAWPAGGRDSVELAVDVAARRDLTFWVGAETVTATGGAMIELGYRLHNRGNGSDTLGITVDAPQGWTARTLPSIVGLAPGDTAAGTVQLALPEHAAAGEEHHIRITVRGSDVQRSHSVRAVVVSEEGWLGGVAHVPGRIFVGSSSGGGGAPGVGLQAAGEVRPGARVSVALRHSDDLDIAPAFVTSLGGPRVQLGVETRSWDLRLGDIFAPADILMGPVVQGRGGEVEVRHGRGSAGLFVATPQSYRLIGETGLLLRGTTGLDTELGRFGLNAGSVRRESDLFGPTARTGIATTWRYRVKRHDLDAEAGMLAVSGDSGGASGFAGQARYLYTFERGSVTARLRKVPATTRASAGQGNEAFLATTFLVTPSTSAIGWAYAASAPHADGTPYGSSRGGAAGLRMRFPREVQGELLGTYRAGRIIGDTFPTTVTRAVRAALDIPLGAFTLESDAELGSVRSDEARPYRTIRAGARWSAYRQWGWLGLSHYDLGLGTPLTGLDVAGAVTVRAVELKGGLNLRLSGLGASNALSFWSGATVPLTRDLGLALGADRQAGSSSPWRFSLGISHAFGLPLPLPRQAPLQGVVFEDLNGNRTQDPGEPRLGGIGLLLGPLRTESGPDGRFRFFDAAPGELRLDRSGLPLGVVVPAEVHLPTRGYVEIPVIRTAALELQIFMDRDGDRLKDEVEDFAAGAVVSVRDAGGRTRDAMADDDGRVRFGSLPPGPYTVLIYPQGGGREASIPTEIEILLEPAGTLSQLVPIPFRRREIRGQGSSPAGLDLQPSERR
ncbi:MAG: hypothetical protein KY466_09980 [Gemmatimonadetes bacterium]|nr:hypothetical protein [Gemmatimonadota bacterium]